MHFPWGHPRRPLAVILPCGARTFLGCGLSALHPQLFISLCPSLYPIFCPLSIPTQCTMCNVQYAMCKDYFLRERSVTVTQLHTPNSTLFTLSTLLKAFFPAAVLSLIQTMFFPPSDILLLLRISGKRR